MSPWAPGLAHIFGPLIQILFFIILFFNLKIKTEVFLCALDQWENDTCCFDGSIYLPVL